MGWLIQKLRLPSLLGMILPGMIQGPYALNGLDRAILTRTGLSLDVEDLKRIGRPALLMTFLPAVAEIAGVVLLAPVLFGMSLVEPPMLGSVMAAVSPAVNVPRMIIAAGQGRRTCGSSGTLIRCPDGPEGWDG